MKNNLIKRIKHIIAIFILIITYNSYSIMNNGNNIKFWNIKSIKGSIGFESAYFNKEVFSAGVSDQPESYQLMGIGRMDIQNYILHPSLLGLDFSMEYNPGTYKENFLVIPDRSDVKTAENINFMATLFNQKPLNFSFYGSYGHTFINREFTSDMDSRSSIFGTNLSFANDIVPVSITYNDSKSDQIEVGIARRYKTEQKNISADLNKSYEFSNHSLDLSYNDDSRTQEGLMTNNSKNLNINLRNNFYMEKEQKNILSSNITYLNYNGIQDISRINIMEFLKIDLPERFTLTGHYDLTQSAQNLKNSAFNMTQNDYTARLSHQLYLSLDSYGSYQYTDISHSSYNLQRNYADVGFRFKKMIPTNGLLLLNYNLNFLQENRESLTQVLEVFDEYYTLTDNSSHILRSPDIEKNSIRVTDASQLIVYQENIDYILLQRGRFIEIQRLPGGLIDNGSTVLIDYRANYDDSYKYSSLNHSYSGSINLFDQFFEIYFSGINQQYLNKERTELLSLQLISKISYGGKINYQGLEIGAEFEDYGSNITPYKLMRYYLDYSNVIDNNLIVAASCNLRTMQYTETFDEQKYSDISGKLDYRLSEMFNFKIDGGYRLQKGKGINMELFTFRGEIGVLIRQINIKLGVENYTRNYLEEKLNYISGYMKIERNF